MFRYATHQHVRNTKEKGGALILKQLVRKGLRWYSRPYPDNHDLTRPEHYIFSTLFTHYQFREQSQSATLTIRTKFDPFLIFLAMFGLLTSWIAGMFRMR